MNKTELIAAVAEHADIDRKTAAKAIDAVLAVVPMAVAAGDQVSIVGFGSWEAVHRPARTARNPQNGEAIEVPETWAPKFKAGSAFRGLVAASESLKAQRVEA